MREKENSGIGRKRRRFLLCPQDERECNLGHHRSIPYLVDYFLCLQERRMDRTGADAFRDLVLAQLRHEGIIGEDLHRYAHCTASSISQTVNILLPCRVKCSCIDKCKLQEATVVSSAQYCIFY